MSPSPTARDPGSAALAERAAGAFLSDDPAAVVAVRGARSPQARGSLGFAGPVVEVTMQEPFVPGSLLVRVDPDRGATLDTSSLRLFRWDATARAFTLVEPSGVGAGGGYVWGRIAGAGRYTAIGLSSDPATLMTLGALGAARALVPSLGADERGALHRRICELAPPRAGPDTEDLAERCRRLVQPFALPELELTASAADRGWASLGPITPPGGEPRPWTVAVRAIAVASGEPEGVYAGTARAGLWRLTETDAIPLTQSDGPLEIRAVAVAPSDPRILYLADAEGRVLRSDDAGGTWRPTGGGHPGEVTRLLVHPGDASRLWLAARVSPDDPDEGGAGFWSSTDGGGSWDRVLEGEICDAAVDPADPAVLHAAARGEGVMRSDDAGATWARVLPFVSERAHGGREIRVALGGLSAQMERTVAALLGQEVFVSRHGGRRPWVSKGWRGGEAPDGAGGSVAVDPHGDEVLLVGGSELVRTESASEAGGGRWETLAPGGAIGCLVPDPARPGVILAGGERGVVRSDDRGATWTPLGTGAGTPRVAGAAIGGVGIVAVLETGGLVARATQADAAWWYVDDTAGLDLHTIVADPREPVVYLLGAGCSRLLITEPRTASLQRDWGPVRPVSAAADPGPGGPLLVGTADRILRLRDRDRPEAHAWEDPEEAWSARPIAAIAFAPGSPGVAYAISEGGDVHHQPDAGGETWGGWTRTGSWDATGVRGLAVNLLDERRLYAIAPGEIARSSDRGASWHSMRGTLPDVGLNALVTHPRNAETLLVAADAGIFVSTDEGASWRSCDEGLPRSPVVEIGWWGADLVAVTRDHGAWRRHLRL